MNPIYRLDISWSTSRGADTYGYNICRLDDSVNHHRFRCMGGGYDMIGTVVADWFTHYFQEKLTALREGRETVDCGYTVSGYTKIKGELYGLTYRPDGTAQIDGACGISSVISIIEACGFEVQWCGNRKGHTIGYFVQEKGE